ncbi:MAG: DUF3427 domain-containing protein [Proteobacteria bacterium]|nr:MAG: DUF3427 domain-containing protein [Pseudomonadota bacterium]
MYVSFLFVMSQKHIFSFLILHRHEKEARRRVGSYTDSTCNQQLGTPTILINNAGIVNGARLKNEDNLERTIFNKWCSTSSMSYFQFIIKAANVNFQIDLNLMSKEEQAYALMLYYDYWTQPRLFNSIEDGIRAIGDDPRVAAEILQVIDCLADRISSKELPIELPNAAPLKTHSRYTREQILVAFGFSTFEKKSGNREGVAYSKDHNFELLFVTLDKTDGGFSPTTLYADFAINDRLFHWQSQNSARPDAGKGNNYLRQQEIGRRILLFVRERVKDEYGRTLGYVFLGDADFVSATGAKPMSVNWELQEPMPSYLWKDAAKMAVG